MALNRVKREKNDNYSTICNCIMREKTISLKAKGLYALVMSLPPTWDFSVQGIVAISKEESGAIYTAIKELINEGYCKRSMVSEKGRFVGCEYTFFNKKRKPQEEEPHNEKPLGDFPHTENEEDNKLFNESNSSSNTTPTELNNKKELSNDNQKVVYSEDFLNFWKLYHEGSKQQAYKEWKKLKDKEKEKAITLVDNYLKLCLYSGRKKKDVSSYLHQHGFDEDWLETPDCYVVKDGDSERMVKFKNYMVSKHIELIFHRNPITFEQLDECFAKYTYNQTEWAMNKLKQRDIHQYFSILKGIEAVINDNSEFEEKEDEQ